MTTAARPTYAPARGGSGKGEGDLSVLSKQYSSRDLPSHTKLKTRQTGQDTTEEIRSRDFRQELEERERIAAKEKNKEKGHRSYGESSAKKSRLEMLTTSNLDVDDPVDEDDDDSDDSDDEDDTAELLAELQKIKRERAEEQAKKEAEKKAEEERIRTENIITGNPLLAGSVDHKVKRRYIQFDDNRSLSVMLGMEKYFSSCKQSKCILQNSCVEKMEYSQTLTINKVGLIKHSSLFKKQHLEYS